MNEFRIMSEAWLFCQLCCQCPGFPRMMCLSDSDNELGSNFLAIKPVLPLPDTTLNYSLFLKRKQVDLKHIFFTKITKGVTDGQSFMGTSLFDPGFRLLLSL